MESKSLKVKTEALKKAAVKTERLEVIRDYANLKKGFFINVDNVGKEFYKSIKII